MFCVLTCSFVDFGGLVVVLCCLIAFWYYRFGVLLRGYWFCGNYLWFRFAYIDVGWLMVCDNVSL